MTNAVWIKTARELIGTREFPGTPNNPVIMRWAALLGRSLGITYSGDATPWCGVFVGHVMRSNAFTPPAICVRASEWLKFGQPCGLVYGAICVFARQGGGHVGFLIGKDATHLHILGGNQSDGVNVMRIEKNRLVPGGTRWPSRIPMDPMVKNSVFRGPTSTNEA